MGRPKTVAVLIDRLSVKNLRSQGVTIEEMLEAANRNFRKQSMSIRYELKSVKKWPGTKIGFFGCLRDLALILLFSIFNAPGASFLLMQLAEIREQMLGLIKRLFIKEKPDIILLFAGHIICGEGYAYAPDKFLLFGSLAPVPTGQGWIVLGTFSEKDDDSIKDSRREFYAEMFMHECGHLYGLKHSNKKYTLMYPYGSCGGPKLDRKSKKALQKHLLNKAA